MRHGCDIGVSVTTKDSVIGLIADSAAEGIDFTSESFIALLSWSCSALGLDGLGNHKNPFSINTIIGNFLLLYYSLFDILFFSLKQMTFPSGNRLKSLLFQLFFSLLFSLFFGFLRSFSCLFKIRNIKYIDKNQSFWNTNKKSNHHLALPFRDYNPRCIFFRYLKNTREQIKLKYKRQQSLGGTVKNITLFAALHV